MGSEFFADGTLRLHGWFFKITTAELFSYDSGSRQFSPLIGENNSKLDIDTCLIVCELRWIS